MSVRKYGLFRWQRNYTVSRTGTKEGVMTESQAPETEAEVLRRGAKLLAERVPGGWTTSLAPGPDGSVDALIEVRDVEGDSATLVVEARRVVEGRDVGPLEEQLHALTQRVQGGQGLVAARYLSPPVREKLTAAGLSYVDATGNMRVEFQKPGLFLSDRGADRDPWRGPGRPRGTLKGEPATKIVRALTDFSGSWTVRQLVDVSMASTGATYRVVDFLEREGMATRDEEGRVDVADWSQVLRRWSDEYGFVRTNQVTRWIAPRGLPGLLGQIGSTGSGAGDGTGYGGGSASGAGRGDGSGGGAGDGSGGGSGGGSGPSPGRYAVTGSIAAAQWAAYAPARLAMIYVADNQEAAAGWGLRPAEAGANVVLAEPKFEVVFERSMTNSDGITIAAPSQVVVDLMTGPGRNPSEAEELLEWMRRNEQSWRA